VLALDQASLTVHAGEVVAVVGENGAGKSTLMKVLAGIHPPDSGQLFLDGMPLRLTGVADAMNRGIVLIHQELNLAENLSASANIFLGRERTWFGWLDRRTMDGSARRLLDRVGLNISPRHRVADLPPGQRQLIEVARALSMNARIIIMDEPTSSLTQREADRLFEVIAELKQCGVAVVYISHRLGEVQQVADRVVVLRDGRNSGELARNAIHHAAMVRLMVGRDLTHFFHRQHRVDAGDRPARLMVRDLCYSGGPPTPISFQVNGGEVVGMAGLVGAGRTELTEALFGIRRILAGQVLLGGRPIRIRRPAQAIAAGLLLVPEDRRHHGLVLQESVRDNIGLPNLDRLSLLHLLLRQRERELARGWCDRLGIKTPGLGQAVGLLSGGNQQKVVFGKWLARQPRVLILDEPTRGVDVAARSEIYALVDELAGTGVAILMVSSDLEEILGMSDRVLVLHQGKLAGELSRDALSEEAVLHLATGGSAAPDIQRMSTPKNERGESTD
jgi:ribose transport system ATP-binding protein